MTAEDETPIEHLESPQNGQNPWYQQLFLNILYTEYLFKAVVFLFSKALKYFIISFQRK